jgi:hypothetical protein
MRIGSSGPIVSVFGDKVGVIVGVIVIVGVAVDVGVSVIVGVEVGNGANVLEGVSVGSKAAGAGSSCDGPQLMSKPHIKTMIKPQMRMGCLKIISSPPMNVLRNGKGRHFNIGLITAMKFVCSLIRSDYHKYYTESPPGIQIENSKAA